MWKLRKFTLTLIWQKFRESNVCTTEIIYQFDEIFVGETEFFIFLHCNVSNFVWKSERFTFITDKIYNLTDLLKKSSHTFNYLLQ